MHKLVIFLMIIIVASFNCLSCNDKYLSKYKIETVNFKGQFLKVKRLSHEHFNRKVKTNDIGKENSIYIVFKQDGHVYLATQQYKYEASIGYRKSEYFNHNLVKPGFIIELSSPDKDLAAIADQYITKLNRDRFISCAQGVCKPLHELGIFDRKVGSHLLPSTLLKSLVKASNTNLIYDYYIIGNSNLSRIHTKAMTMGLQGFLLSFCPLFWFL